MKSLSYIEKKVWAWLDSKLPPSTFDHGNFYCYAVREGIVYIENGMGIAMDWQGGDFFGRHVFFPLESYWYDTTIIPVPGSVAARLRIPVDAADRQRIMDNLNIFAKARHEKFIFEEDMSKLTPNGF